MRKTELRNIARKATPGATAALVLAFALTATGCRDDGGFLGETMTLTGQVWFSEDGGRVTEFTETRTLTSYPPGGSGGIIGGRLEFSMGRPADEHLQSIVDLVRDMERDGIQVNASPATARFTFLELVIPNGRFGREHSASAETATTSNWERDSIIHIFVDRNVTLSSAGESETHQGRTWVFEPFNITLREGWNALHSREFEDVDGNNMVSGFALSHADPDHLKWVLSEWEDRSFWDWDDYWGW